MGFPIVKIPCREGGGVSLIVPKSLPELPPEDVLHLAVDRAIGDLRRGRAVAVLHDGRWRYALALETGTRPWISHLLAHAAALGITRERAEALGLQAATEALQLELSPSLDAEQLLGLGRHWHVDAWQSAWSQQPLRATAADVSLSAAVQLAKRAQLLPAVLVSQIQEGTPPEGLWPVQVAQLERHSELSPADVVRVSEARVPLSGNEASHLVLFRDRRDASEHVAVQVGQADLTGVVPVRVHSSCFTGDLLGSLRCDCGEQLQQSVARMREAGGGVLIYLAQEGRGIGLANKLRAYQLQDAGLDTVDADRHLGFSADERSYALAAEMLKGLGVTRIRLLTNSPHKVRELRERGILVEAVEQVAVTPNQHNARYLQTKRERSGHS